MQSVLLIGGDARLSRYIDSRFASTILTTRRKNNSSSNRLFLDLNDTTCFAIPEGITSCVIVGGPISYEDSEKNYLTSLEVHSKQIPYLVESLFSRNIFTIYISSNMVFGEKSLNRNEYSLTSPDIKYGMLKDICEKALIHTADQLEKSSLLAIARLTKNVSCDTRPFDAWISNYINDEEIIAFDDLFLVRSTFLQVQVSLLKF